MRKMCLILLGGGAFSIISPSFALAAEVADLGGNVQTLINSLNMVWVMVASALVFVMQAGFMCVEAGLAQAKHSINVAIKNLADFVLAAVLFWLIGFGLMFGDTVQGIIGTSHFVINLADPWMVVFFVFQSVFVGTAATIDSGAVAGRTKFFSYLVISSLVSVVVYPIFGHWAWGGLLIEGQTGWLEAMGFLDFAGSTVVHSVGGWMALVGVIVIGPRQGKYDREGNPRPIPPHNMTLAYLGTFILFFGWFGFNCGSTLEASPDVAGIALNTMLAACFGSISCSALSWFTSPFKRPEGEMIANGILGGLVGITAGCAFVETWGAMIIGLVAGALVYYGIHFFERVLKVDDVVGAITVHGVCGAWGTIAVGLFITPEHLGETARLSQLGVQILGVVVCFIWTFGVGFILVKLVNITTGGLRVSPEDEEVGLNVSEHGASSSILDLARAMRQVVQTGKYEGMVNVEQGTEAGDLARFFNRMIKALSDEKRKSAEKFGVYDRYMKDSQQKIAMDTSQIAELMGEVRLEAKTMSQMVRDAVDRISSLVASLTGASEQASQRSAESSKKVNVVVGTIDRLAFQTQILAINASVEAARAGEAGQGFAVVAGNVKELADQTNQSNQEVGRHIGDIQKMNGLLVETIAKDSEEARKVAESVDQAAAKAQRMAELLDQAGQRTDRVFEMVRESYERFQDLSDQQQRYIDDQGGSHFKH